MARTCECLGAQGAGSRQLPDSSAGDIPFPAGLQPPRSQRALPYPPDLRKIPVGGSYPRISGTQFFSQEKFTYFIAHILGQKFTGQHILLSAI